MGPTETEMRKENRTYCIYLATHNLWNVADVQRAVLRIVRDEYYGKPRDGVDDDGGYDDDDDDDDPVWELAQDCSSLS